MLHRGTESETGTEFDRAQNNERTLKERATVESEVAQTFKFCTDIVSLPDKGRSTITGMLTSLTSEKSEAVLGGRVQW